MAPSAPHPPPPHSLLSQRSWALLLPSFCTPLNGAVEGATAPPPPPSQPAVAEPTGPASPIVLFPSEWCCRGRNSPSPRHPQPAVAAPTGPASPIVLFPSERCCRGRNRASPPPPTACCHGVFVRSRQAAQACRLTGSNPVARMDQRMMSDAYMCLDGPLTSGLTSFRRRPRNVSNCRDGWNHRFAPRLWS